MKKIIIYLSCISLLGCKEIKQAVAPAPKPKAEFSYVLGKAGQASFTNLSQNATSYIWDFGDGRGDIIKNPGIYQFEKNGQFSVTLTASGEGGSDVISKSIAIDNVQGSLIVYKSGRTNTKNISVYVDNVFIGTVTGNLYYQSAPDCGASASATTQLSEGTHSVYGVEVSGSSPIKWNSTIKVIGGSCAKLGLN